MRDYLSADIPAVLRILSCEAEGKIVFSNKQTGSFSKILLDF
jgi:hypothetical protein